MKKSVLLIGNFAPPFGGIPIHLDAMAPYFVGKGWDVHIITPKVRAEGGRDPRGFDVHASLYSGRGDQLQALLRNPGKLLRHFRFFLANHQLFLRSLLIYEQAKLLAKQAGVRVVSAYHVFPAGLAAAWLAEDLKIPYVLNVFGETYEAPDWFNRHRKEAEFVLGNAGARVAPSRHCACGVPRLGLPFPIDTLYYGIDTQRFTPAHDPQHIRARYGILAGDKVALYVGRMTKVMGLGVLLDGVPDLLAGNPDIRILIAGQRAELTDAALAAAKKYPANIFVAPNVSAEDLPYFYAAADVVAIPSINERACLGLAIIEAMATAKPVVVSDIGGGPEVMSRPELGRLVPPLDAAATARAILDLTSMDASQKELNAQMARQVAVSQFDLTQCGEKMDTILTRLLGCAT